MAGDQGTIAGEVAFTYPHVDLRHQHLARLAIGQGYRALHQPDDIAGQLGHLPGSQGNTRHQVPVVCQGNGIIDQGPVLGFVAGITVEEAAPSELGNLFADQLLFVEAIAQAQLGGGRVDLQAVEHVVRRQPLTVAGEARVRLDQVTLGACRVGLEQAVARQRQARRAAAYQVGHALAVFEFHLYHGAHLVLLADLGVHLPDCRDLLAHRLLLAPVDLGAAATDGGVLAILGGGEVDVLD